MTTTPFLGLFNGLERVWVVADEYWVDVKRSLSAADYETAQRTLIGALKVVDGDMQAEPDSVGYQLELVFLGVQDWNLTDEVGNALPLSPAETKRQSIKRLPQSVFLQLYQRIHAASSPRSADEQVRFRAGDAGDDRGNDPASADA